MTRRAALPGADELFRTTTTTQSFGESVRPKMSRAAFSRKESGQGKHVAMIPVYAFAGELRVCQARQELDE